MFINQDWLDAVNMKAPTNVDELYTVLKAFKTQNPNGVNGNDELPMFSSGIWNYVINAYVYYNQTNPFNVTDGKVWSPVRTDEYRQALIYLNKLCKEGLLSDLSLTATGADAKQLISGSGTVAKVGIWSGHPLTWTTTSSEVLDQYTALKELSDETGKGGYGVQQANYQVYGGFITKDCEDTETAMKFFDFFYFCLFFTFIRSGIRFTFIYVLDSAFFRRFIANNNALYFFDVLCCNTLRTSHHTT